jgi:hypothetical protein
MTYSIPHQTFPSPAHASPPLDSATRHLCAAAYLDEAFQQISLREAYFQVKRVVAPSYGYRVIPVLWHCLRARRAAIIRDVVIAVLLVLSICTFGVGFLFVIVFLAQLQVSVMVIRMVRDSVQQVRSGGSLDMEAMVARGRVLLVGLIFLALMWGLFWLFSLGALASDAGGLMVIILIGIILALMITTMPVVTDLWRQRQVERFTPGKVVDNPPRSPRFDQIHQQQHGDTVVYSGYLPFVGSGEIIDTWGFAQRLVRPDNGIGPLSEFEREFEQAPFTAAEILGYVAGQLRVLAEDPNPERRLPGLTVNDRVFLAGTEVSHLSTVTGPERMADIIRHPTQPARHYLVCQVVSWDGELVTTVYVHFAVQGRTLYLEITATALPPCDDGYRIVDDVDGTGGLAYLRAVVRGVANTPRTVAAAPINLARAIADGIGSSTSAAATTAPVTQGFDYGARVSVRELGASEVTRNHIQTQDILKFKRIIERRVLASVLDFLESRGVDTTEYRQRALTVLNAGAVNMGSGSMVVGAAVGQHHEAPVPVRPGSR